MKFFGVSQIKNSTNIEQNFESIMRSLTWFQSTDAKIILFPECSLSGFSGKIKECTPELLAPYLEKVERWSFENNKVVILPTAIFDGDIYNTGFVFCQGQRSQFYKVGLTESEKKFFSLPKNSTQKVFEIDGLKIGILICYEAQMEPWQFFNEGEVDLILWPGYWGWKEDDEWAELKKEGEENLIFKNMKQWKVPLIQSNFAYNSPEITSSTRPSGLSFFIDEENELVARGSFKKESCHLLTFSPETQKVLLAQTVEF